MQCQLLSMMLHVSKILDILFYLFIFFFWENRDFFVVVEKLESEEGMRDEIREREKRMDYRLLSLFGYFKNLKRLKNHKILYKSKIIFFFCSIYIYNLNFLIYGIHPPNFSNLERLKFSIIFLVPNKANVQDLGCCEFVARSILRSTLPNFYCN